MTGDWLAYDELHIGSVYPNEPARFVVTQEVVEGFRKLAASSRIDAGDADLRGDEAPPMLAAVYIRGAQDALRGPPGGIHAKQRFAFSKEVRVGDVLDTVLTIKDKYERKGRRYVVSETRTTNQSGQEVSKGEIVSIWGGQK
jgi:3-hydroxybutyryl-CoA dehydratase